MIDVSEFRKKQILVVCTPKGEKLSFKNDNIIVTAKDGEILHQSTCFRLFIVIVIGHITVTSGLIQRAKKFGFSICLMTPSMRLYDRIGHRMEGNTLLRKRQYSYDKNDIAKAIVERKIINQKIALEHIRSKTVAVSEAIEMLDKHTKAIRCIDYMLEQLLGVEGSAARVYFSQMFNNVRWAGRKPRVKCDYVNSSLDVGYTILFNLVDAIIGVFGFDEYCGVLHKQFYMRKSLVCDLVEPIRPIIDYQLRKSINLGQCQEKDFIIMNHQFVLSWKETPRYVQFFMESLLEQKEAIFLYIQDYYRSFMKDKDPKEYKLFEVRF